MRYVAFIFGTNNIDKKVPEDILKVTKYKCCISKVIVLAVFPRDFSPGIRKDKIKSIKFQVKDIITEMNNKVVYRDPVHAWTTSGGTLNKNLYYKDNLHLIEKGNEKLPKRITTIFNVGSFKLQQPQHQNKNRPQEHQQKNQQHQQENHQYQQQHKQHKKE